MVNHESLTAIRAELEPYHATLVAVSKTKPVDDISEAYTAGQRDFGENYVMELATKQAVLPPGIHWHFIGHLQRNKVKAITPFVSLVQSVDSLKLAREIQKQGAKNNRVIPCLLQVHIAEEETKFGFSIDEARDLVAGDELASMDHVSLRGLMGMASFTDDESRVRSEFRSLKKLFDELTPAFPADAGDDSFSILSMGMTGDYRIALDEGSNMVRIGSAIFGSRS